MVWQASSRSSVRYLFCRAPFQRDPNLPQDSILAYLSFIGNIMHRKKGPIGFLLSLAVFTLEPLVINELLFFLLCATIVHRLYVRVAQSLSPNLSLYAQLTMAIHSIHSSSPQRYTVAELWPVSWLFLQLIVAFAHLGPLIYLDSLSLIMWTAATGAVQGGLYETRWGYALILASLGASMTVNDRLTRCSVKWNILLPRRHLWESLAAENVALSSSSQLNHHGLCLLSNWPGSRLPLLRCWRVGCLHITQAKGHNTYHCFGAGVNGILFPPRAMFGRSSG